MGEQGQKANLWSRYWSKVKGYRASGLGILWTRQAEGQGAGTEEDLLRTQLGFLGVVWELSELKICLAFPKVCHITSNGISIIDSS